MSDWPTGPLLVSSVNGGGVFAIVDGQVERWSKVDTTGIALRPDGALLARQAEGRAELRWLRGREVARVQLVDRSLDLHDVLWHDGRIYVVATQINTVFEFDESYVELRHWSFPGEEDSQHINSFCVYRGRLLASRFGRFLVHRGYKGATRGAGEVFDVETGEVLLGGLSQPHSLHADGDRLWLCDSEAGTLRCYRGFEQAGAWHLGGYVRGLSIGGGVACVGLSRSRNAEPGALARGAVIALDLRDMSEIARLEIPANEVYDIRMLPADALPDLRAAAMADAIAEYDTQVDERNRAVDAATRAAGAEALATALHQANLRIAELEQATAAQAGQLRGTSAELSRLRTLAEEEAAWLAMVDQHASHLRAIVQRQGELLEERQAFIDALTASRSWRWTRPLRAAEPVAPGPAREGAPADTLAALVPPGPPSRADLPLAGLAFEPAEAPVVSIVVAAHGSFDATRACLESIRDAGAGVPFEVILVEDASGDSGMDRFRLVPGLHYCRNPSNMGFLRSMNAALDMVRGEYVHFLNNDTLVTPGWLDALLRTFQLCRDCGLAGARLVYPDGRLQEAGAVVWSDGDGWNVGRGGDPHDPAHSAVREVDYTSGAAILLRTDVLRDLGGFDERYAPAYYEDTDLAFRLRERGLRTYYQPASTVIHQEGLSHGTDADSGGKAWQARNRDVFRARWAGTLAREQLPPGQHPYLARSRAQLKKLVLVVDRHLPRTDRDAGSRATWQLMRLMQDHGFEVKFWSFEHDADQRSRDLLDMHAIEAAGQGGAGDGFEEWIAGHGRYFDYVVLNRPHVADALVDAVRDHSSARVLYYGHDVHHLRLAAQHALEPSTELVRQAEHVRMMEERVWGKVDVILYPAEAETRHVQAWIDGSGAHAMAATVPLFAYAGVSEQLDASEPRGDRDTVLFVGGFGHAPNADGVGWFLSDVWPLVRDGAAALRLMIVGADPGPEILALAGDGVEIAGSVPEEALDAAYRRARLAIAPLRFGAGVKGKVLEAMRHGVPCVTTTVGAQGLEAATSLRVADDAEGFAAHILALAADDAAWRDASTGGLAFIRAHFSEAALLGALSAFMDPAPHADVATRLAAISTAGRHPGPG